MIYRHHQLNLHDMDYLRHRPMTVGPDNSDQTPCKMERVDEHPLQLHSLPSSLFCNFSRASTDAVLENSLHYGFRELVLPFLSELTNQEVGYDCISLLLLHYLLASPTGYDARVRFIFKRFAVVVLICTSTTPMDIAEATPRRRLAFTIQRT
jgi:hypothetical protein